MLCRSLPAPERADAAALLAASALLRGDGALATLAVERALADRPDHEVASVVDASLRSALGAEVADWPYAGPDGLRRLLRTVCAAPPDARPRSTDIPERGGPAAGEDDAP